MIAFANTCQVLELIHTIDMPGAAEVKGVRTEVHSIDRGNFAAEGLHNESCHLVADIPSWFVRIGIRCRMPLILLTRKSPYRSQL